MIRRTTAAPRTSGYSIRNIPCPTIRFHKQEMIEHSTPRPNNYIHTLLIFGAQIFLNFKRLILYIVEKTFKNRNSVVSLHVEPFKYVIYFNRIRFVFTLNKLRLIEKQLLLLAII